VFVSESSSSKPHWSDRKADTVATLVVFVALVLAAVYFISGQG
jgi:hypothetical protein